MVVHDGDGGPGVAVVTAATLPATVGTGFPAARLASYADFAPTTKSSGTFIHGEHAPTSGGRQLKRAMFLSAFAALHVPASRTPATTHAEPAGGHTGPLHLARQRIDVLFAMLRDSVNRA